MSKLHKIPTKWASFYQLYGWANKALTKFKVNFPTTGRRVEKWTRSFWPQNFCVHNALQLYSNKDTQWRCGDTSSYIKLIVWAKETKQSELQSWQHFPCFWISWACMWDNEHRSVPFFISSHLPTSHIIWWLDAEDLTKIYVFKRYMLEDICLYRSRLAPLSELLIWWSTSPTLGGQELGWTDCRIIPWALCGIFLKDLNSIREKSFTIVFTFLIPIPDMQQDLNKHLLTCG